MSIIVSLSWKLTKTKLYVIHVLRTRNFCGTVENLGHLTEGWEYSGLLKNQMTTVGVDFTDDPKRRVSGQLVATALNK